MNANEVPSTATRVPSEDIAGSSEYESLFIPRHDSKTAVEISDTPMHTDDPPCESNDLNPTLDPNIDATFGPPPGKIVPVLLTRAQIQDIEAQLAKESSEEDATRKTRVFKTEAELARFEEENPEQARLWKVCRYRPMTEQAADWRDCYCKEHYPEGAKGPYWDYCGRLKAFHRKFPTSNKPGFGP